MPCDMERIDAATLKFQGWTDAQIARLQAEVAAAEAKAEIEVRQQTYGANARDKRRIQEMVDEARRKAAKKARKVAHDRFHMEQGEELLDGINQKKRERQLDGSGDADDQELEVRVGATKKAQHAHAHGPGLSKHGLADLGFDLGGDDDDEPDEGSGGGGLFG